MTISTSAKQLAWLFSIAVGLLVFSHIVVQTLRFATGDHFLYGLVPLLSIGSDGNLPTCYSALAILLCAGLLGAIGHAERTGGAENSAYWFGLGAIFVFLSLDEMLALHEHLIEPVRALLGTSGVFFYAWIIPYGIALILFGMVYLRFLLRLPARTARLFVLAGVIFVGGAMGIEMLGGQHSETYGNLNVTYVALQTVEESLEMIGIVVFLYAIADYIESRFGELVLRIAPPA